MPRSSTSVLCLDDEKGQQELRPRGPSAMLPLSPHLKDAFEKFERDLWPLRELYITGITCLLRYEAEMTLLQAYLRDSRRQELRNSPYWPTPLFKSQLVKDGEDFLL